MLPKHIRGEGSSTVEFGPSQATIAPAGIGTPPLLLRAADYLSDAAGFLRRPLVAEELIAAAEHRTGLSDFGEWQFITPLKAKGLDSHAYGERLAAELLGLLLPAVEERAEVPAHAGSLSPESP